MDDRQLARCYAGGRVLIGLVLVLFPGLGLRGMLGAGPASGAGVKMVGRLLGARDAILGAGTLAALRGGVPDGAGRWMTYGSVADGADVLSILLAYRSLPSRKRFVMVVMAAAGAATGAYLSTRFDESAATS